MDELARVRAELERAEAERARLERELAAARAELERSKPPEPVVREPRASERPTVAPPLPADTIAALAIQESFVVPSARADIAAESSPDADGAALRNVVVVVSDADAEPLSPSDLADRRRETRHACSFAVEFMHETFFFAGLTQDVSQGGVFVATYRLVPVGTVLELDLELPDGSRAHVRGEVRWVREPRDGEGRPGLGISFLDLDAATHERIADICLKQPPVYVEI